METLRVNNAKIPVFISTKASDLFCVGLSCSHSSIYIRGCVASSAYLQLDCYGLGLGTRLTLSNTDESCSLAVTALMFSTLIRH